MGQGAESCPGYELEYDPEDDLDWVFEQARKNKVTPKISPNEQPTTQPTTPQKTRGRKVEKSCKECGEKHTVRVADLNRGWGLFCSKSCKATYQVKH